MLTISIIIIIIPREVEDDDVNFFRFPVDSVNIRLEDLLKLDSRVHLEMHPSITFLKTWRKRSNLKIDKV